MQTWIDAFELFACTMSTLSFVFLLLQKVKSSVITHPFFIPFYLFGMIQWGLFGLNEGRPVVATTSVLQILILIPLTQRWWKELT